MSPSDPSSVFVFGLAIPMKRPSETRPADVTERTACRRARSHAQEGLMPLRASGRNACLFS